MDTALVAAAKHVRREADISAFESIQRIYTRLNLALDACDRELYDEETGEYRFDVSAMEALGKNASELRKTIEAVPKLMAFLELQRQQADASANEEGELRDVLEGALAGKLEGILVARFGGVLTEDVAEKLAGHVAAGVLEDIIGVFREAGEGG